MKKELESPFVLFQAYPMRMQIKIKEIKKNEGFFVTKLSKNDFFQSAVNFIPVSFFIELLGQASEVFFQMCGDRSKRYLAQLFDFHVNIECFTEYDQELEINVKLVQKMGRIYKSKIKLFTNKNIICEGIYVHCNA